MASPCMLSKAALTGRVFATSFGGNMPGRMGLATPGWMCRYSCLWRSAEDLHCRLTLARSSRPWSTQTRRTEKSYCSGGVPGAHPSSMCLHLTRVGSAGETEAENKLPCMVHASVVHTGQLPASRSRHKLSSGIICRGFLHLECVRGSISPLFGNS